jgi:HEAT repeats
MFCAKSRIALVSCVIVVAVALAIYSHSRRGPVYQGEPLETWIHRLGGSYIPNEIWGSPSRAEAIKAIRAIGPEGIPVLIESLDHKEWYVRLGAADGLCSLGPQAAPAIEPLLEAFDNEANRMVRRHIETALQQIREGSKISEEQTKAVE